MSSTSLNCRSFDSDSKNSIRKKLSLISEFYNRYSWLADSLVLNFFGDKQWEKLPESWQSFFSSFSLEEFGAWMIDPSETNGKVIPEDLREFRETVETLSLSRTPINVETVFRDEGTFGDIFKRHVKPKKRYEIERLCNLISECANKTKTTSILDIGSGLGHLSRYLAYSYQLQMTCVDCVETFTASAEKLDKQIEKTLSKQGQIQSLKPAHVTLKLDMDSSGIPKEKFKEFGIIGLHSCGDLAPLILNTFVTSAEAKFVVSVGCCYMKMSEKGFPLSEFLKSELTNLRFSYEALEVSCHAIEEYSERLVKSDYQKLKIHAYRSALEYLIIQKYPEFRRSGLKGVKQFEEKGFKEYAREALSNFPNIKFTDTELEAKEITVMLKEWWKIVIFYSLRILLAKLIESSILLDRLLFLIENGHSGSILPIFDGNISSRNFAVVCMKDGNPVL